MSTLLLLVTEILIDSGGRACGVRVVKGQQDSVLIHAPLVISNAGVYNSMNMLPRAVADKTSQLYFIALLQYQITNNLWREFADLKLNSCCENIKQCIYMCISCNQRLFIIYESLWL